MLNVYMNRFRFKEWFWRVSQEVNVMGDNFLNHYLKFTYFWNITSDFSYLFKLKPPRFLLPSETYFSTRIYNTLSNSSVYSIFDAASFPFAAFSCTNLAICTIWPMKPFLYFCFPLPLRIYTSSKDSLNKKFKRISFLSN